jgi:predicted nucleotidyltransferase component of viral defense system
MIDYQKLYSLQDRVFDTLEDLLEGFYLTGGTCLSRFYLHHRFSDDLDFFISQTPDFSPKLQRIYHKLKEFFRIDESLTLEADSYTRIWITDPIPMKIDFVNEIPDHWVECNAYKNIKIDTPANILANKLGTIVSREEPKDVFDIVSIAVNYSYNWIEVYKQAIKKQIMNETDIAMFLNSFDVKLLENSTWLKDNINLSDFREKLNIIINDFILGKDNSLGLDKTSITAAEVIL